PALIMEMNTSPDLLLRLRHELKPYRAELVERLKDARTGKTGPLVG
ncbi:MAG: hypothetical protein H7X77_04815, partial [Anaerolineae bacterium]|nr:hypothetical protein [Anaerolineae bacterium]